MLIPEEYVLVLVISLGTHRLVKNICKCEAICRHQSEHRNYYDCVSHFYSIYFAMNSSHSSCDEDK